MKQDNVIVHISEDDLEALKDVVYNNDTVSWYVRVSGKEVEVRIVKDKE